MEQVMNRTLDYLAAKVPTNDHDTYIGDDGLLHCSRCNGARQTVITFNDVKKTVPCICKCMVEELERKEAESRRQAHLAELRQFRGIGFPDAELNEWTFAKDDGATPDATRVMKSYVEHFEEFRKDGKGLFLYGNVGTGKSFFAGCIVNALIDNDYPSLMTNFPRITNQLTGLWDGKQDYLDGLCRFDLVAIDDLGVERDTGFMNENVATVIDSLYRAKVPMIITSNYTPKQLTEDCEMSKRRVFDRLLERCVPVKIDGPSRRKQKGRDQYAAMKRMLGI